LFALEQRLQKQLRIHRQKLVFSWQKKTSPNFVDEVPKIGFLSWLIQKNNACLQVVIYTLLFLLLLPHRRHWATIL
jgi:hypothetical protein